MTEESRILLLAVVAALPPALLLCYVSDRHVGLWDRFARMDQLFHLAFIIYVLVVVAASQHIQINPTGFVDGYYDRAVNMLRYGVYGHEYNASAFFPPGYSILLLVGLMLIGESVLTVPLVNMVLFASVIYLLRYALKRYNVREYNVASFTLLLSLGRFFYHFLPVSDAAASYFLVLSLSLLVISLKEAPKLRILIVSGVFLGFAALIRPNSVLFLVPYAFILWLVRFSSTHWRTAILVFAISVSAPVVMWSWRNFTVFGEPFFVSTNGGYNLFVGNNPQATGTWGPHDQVFERELASKNEAERDRFLGERAMEWILSNPTAFTILTVKKLIRAFSSDTASLSILVSQVRNGRVMPVGETLLALLYTGTNIAYYAVAARFLRRSSSMARTPRLAKDELVATVLLVLCTAAPVGLVFGLSRYRDFFFYLMVISNSGLFSALFSRQRVTEV